MITFSEKQIKYLDSLQEQQFQDKLRMHLQKEYTRYARVAPVIMNYLIGNGLKRAQAYGLSWQSALGQFVYLMAAIAPNFDLHPVIHAGLVNSGISAEERLDSLVKNTPHGVWRDATEEASMMGWYLTADTFTESVAFRIVSALLNSLPKNGLPERVVLHAAVQSAIQQAQKMGFTHEDALFVFCAAQIIYGNGFEARESWARDVFSSTISFNNQVDLLRLRIAIDTAAWV